MSEIRTPNMDTPTPERAVSTTIVKDRRTKRHTVVLDTGVPVTVVLNQRLLFDGDPNQPRTEHINDITLLWECERDGSDTTQPLTDIAQSGTPICGVCDDEMVLSSLVRIDTEHHIVVQE